MKESSLLENIDKIHTTEMGIDRIRKNLCLSDCVDVVSFCIEMVKNEKAVIYRQGKNYYIEENNIKITINASNYVIITAHFLKN